MNTHDHKIETFNMFFSDPIFYL